MSLAKYAGSLRRDPPQKRSLESKSYLTLGEPKRN